MTIQMTAEFEDALSRISEGRNVLITGKAGTGKSTLLRLYLEAQADKEILVVAPTGVAALNVDGFTIHRAFGFRPGLYPEDIGPGGDWHLSSARREVLQNTDILVVDEISMVRADLFDMMDKALRLVRRSTEPFGGVQLVLVGDLLQLPPILANNELEYYQANWDSPYFYSAHCYPDLNLDTVNLTTVWRQADNEFVEVLNQIREGSLDGNAITILDSCVEEDFVPPNDWVTLTAFRRTVDKINMARLEQLPAPKFYAKAEYSGDSHGQQFSGAEELHYAAGARVMTVMNDPAERFVNGSFGEIVAASEDLFSVRLADGGKVVDLPRHTWEINTPKLTDGRVSSETIGSIQQFPVILAWAITIHKSQGKTLPKCYIDLTGGTATDGQFYVALSRAVDLEHLRLSRPVEPRHVRANNSLVRRTRREVSRPITTNKFVFLSFDGVNFSVSQHIARIYCQIVEAGKTVAQFGSWINPMADLGDFGRQNEIPSGGLAMAPTLGNFWPLLRRQAAGGLIIGDRLPMLERAVRHQEKGLDIALGIGYDVSEFDFTPAGADVVARCQSMAAAFLQGKFALSRGEVVPEAPQETEGAVFVPAWAPAQPMELDPRQATDLDLAWAALSGGGASAGNASAGAANLAAVAECANFLATWALSRGCWTAREYEEVVARTRSLGLAHPDLPPVQDTTPNIAELLRPGTRVAFTGRDNLLGAPADDARLREICAARNLEYKTGVSKTMCDVLVARDLASTSGKAKKAREFGKPIIEQSQFEDWWNNGPFLSAEEQEPATPVAFSQPATPRSTAPITTDSASEIADIPELKVGKADVLLQRGTRVAFNGSTYIQGTLVRQGKPLQKLCKRVGLDYKPAVTKTRCDVLVTDSLESTTKKAVLARSYGKPAVLAEDFTRWAEAQLAGGSAGRSTTLPQKAAAELHSGAVHAEAHAPQDPVQARPISSSPAQTVPHSAPSPATPRPVQATPRPAPTTSRPDSPMPRPAQRVPNPATAPLGNARAMPQPTSSTNTAGKAARLLFLMSVVLFAAFMGFAAIDQINAATVFFLFWVLALLGASTCAVITLVRKIRTLMR
ncbi:PIF1-like helicase [Actinobaculum suis]|uniref:AAA family ATPase n=1 Tax=Actinobaculum suis TaxID=1657 RepID=A0A1G7EQD9_9ACTO|nr:AAA family ATPase [Actinobaculum suis]MDY5152846.1 AAA family ATPase [Actinobaculum suis]SDE65787.1 PIF1-like helicase [Actinobaculum suis]